MESNLEFGPDVASTRLEEAIVKVRCQYERTSSWIKEAGNVLDQVNNALAPGDTPSRRNFSI